VFQFILAIILVVIAIVAAFYGAFLAGNGEKGAPVAAAVILVIVAFGFYAWGGVKSVPVKNIGIPVNFGAVGSTVFDPGAHETWEPWMHITDINETVQTVSYEDRGNDTGSSCNGGLRVRIGGQQSACADITIQYQIKPGAAASLFSDYANTGNFMTEVQNAVVVRELEQVVNTEVGDYNPITDVASVTGTSSQPSQFSSFGPAILKQMQADIGTRINVIAVLFTQLNYNSTLESKLAGIQQAYADYATAQENVNVAHEQQLALAKLGNPTMGQLIAQCLVQAKTNTNLQCIPGATTNLNLQGSAK